MQRLRSRRLSLVWAVLLLLGTAMPGLERMSCTMGCPTVFGIGSVDGCCAGPSDHHDGPSIVGDCCDVDRTAPEHHSFISERGATHPVPLAQVAEVPRMLTLAVQHVRPVHSAICTRPPPLLTAERLSRERVYLI